MFIEMFVNKNLNAFLDLFGDRPAALNYASADSAISGSLRLGSDRLISQPPKRFPRAGLRRSGIRTLPRNTKYNGERRESSVNLGRSRTTAAGLRPRQNGETIHRSLPCLLLLGANHHFTSK